MQINATDAWNLYLGIHTTVKQHVAQNGGYDHDLRCALQRLCQAVLIQHKMSKAGYPEIVYKNGKLNVDAIKQLDLTTTRSMVNAEIIEWEEARVGVDGTDSHSPVGSSSGGSGNTFIPAAYEPQNSIQYCLKKDYFEIRASFNANAEMAMALYQKIDDCARRQLTRISQYKITFNKHLEIDFALQRLCQAILQKYAQEKPEEAQFNITIDPERVEALELYSMTSMLDAKIFDGKGNQRLSLRQVLNISRWNPLNFIWYQEAYWGQSSSLQQFERSMSQDTELQRLIN